MGKVEGIAGHTGPEIIVPIGGNTEAILAALDQIAKNNFKPTMILMPLKEGYAFVKRGGVISNMLRKRKR